MKFLIVPLDTNLFTTKAIYEEYRYYYVRIAFLAYMEEVEPVIRGNLILHGIKAFDYGWEIYHEIYTDRFIEMIKNGSIVQMPTDLPPELFYGFVLNRVNGVRESNAPTNYLVLKLIEAFYE